MQRTDIGPRGYVQDLAVATLSFVPQTDRAAKVTRINVTNVNQADVWVVSVGGQEVGRFQQGLDTTQDLLSDSAASNELARDIFEWYEQVYGSPLMYPVPNGETFTVASVGGGTADISVEYMEVDNGDINATLVNHPKGKMFCVPYYASISSAKTIIAETGFDTEIHPAGFPNLFSGSAGQTGYDGKIKALWLAGGTVSSAVTSYLFAIVAGQRMFTRAALGGIPIIPNSGASWIANGPFRAFQNGLDQHNPVIEPNISIPAGVISQWGYGIGGSIGGSEDFSAIQLMALVDITVKGA